MFLIILIHPRSASDDDTFVVAADARRMEKGEKCHTFMIINLYGFLGTEYINFGSIAFRR